MAYKFNKPFNSYLDYQDVGKSGTKAAASLQRKPSSYAGFQSLPGQRPTVQSNQSSGQEKFSALLPPSKPFKLSDFFAQSDVPRSPYSDWDVLEISRYLRESGHQTWSEAPRLYTVLRTIGQLQVLDSMLEEGVSDIWFPFNASSVPTLLSASLRAKFLEVQPLILTKAVDLEKSDIKRHTHFGREDAFPFEVQEKLGKGGSGTVDKIYSPFSRRNFARKRFLRGKNHESKGEIQSFKTELQVLKRIEHHHCIELVASYTDFKYFGLILSPVADCNLAEFYSRVFEDAQNQTLLREFYGCLATGLQYLHNSKIRHRDIKPENILVQNGCVYLADFGISLDWDALTRSTTTEDTGKSWIYCAPEVANYEKRNSSSDIWSLGCVFFEMCTVLKGRTINTMRQHFRKLHDTYKFYQCLRAIHTWSEELLKIGSETDNISLYWAAGMMQPDPESRPNANQLCGEISRLVGKTDQGTKRFCGECCGTGSDAESTSGSVSDGDLWAENMDDEITSPATSPLTSPLITDPSVRPVRLQAEPEADHTSIHDRSMSWSSTGDATAVQGVILEPERPAGASLEVSMRERDKLRDEAFIETGKPVETNPEVIEEVSPQKPVVVVAKPDFREPAEETRIQAPVRSSPKAAAGPSDSLNLLSKLDPSTIGEKTEEFPNKYDARGQVPLETPVESVWAELYKSSITTSPAASKAVSTYPFFSQAHSEEVIGRRDLDDDDSLGHISPDATDIDQVQGSSTEGSSAQKDSEQSNNVQSPPIWPPPIPPKVMLGHEERAEKADANAGDMIAELSPAHTSAMPQNPANRVSSTPSLSSSGEASLSTRSRSSSLEVRPGTPRDVAPYDPSGAKGAGTIVNLQELPTISSEERSMDRVETRDFPFLNAESWRSPGQFVRDVIKDSILMHDLKFDDFRGLVSDKDPTTITALVKEMIEIGLPVHSTILYTDADGYTPLYNILDWGDGYQQLYKLIIDAGAPVDIECHFGGTALIRAARMNHVWAMEMLIAAGADPYRQARLSPLGEAAAGGQLDAVRHLVEHVKCDPGQVTVGGFVDGATPLHCACLGAHVPVVAYLLEHCRAAIDLEARYTCKWGSSVCPARATPLMHAYLNDKPLADRLAVIALLLAHGADPSGGPEVRTGNRSLLHFAAADGHIELVRLLLRYEVKVGTRSVPAFSGRLLGGTPISLAEEKGHAKIVELLRAAKKKGKKEGK